MDLLIIGVLGPVAVLVAILWILSVLGIGEQLLNVLVAIFGAPFIRLSRTISSARRDRSIHLLSYAEFASRVSRRLWCAGRRVLL
jgi:hypothetical protein